MQQLADQFKELDFKSETYKDAYSRINAIVIEGEQEAHDNYITLAQLLPESHDDLIRLSKMESRHKKGFEACGRNLQVTPDLEFAKKFFSGLHQNFQTAAASGNVVTCLLIQSLIIECFAIAAYNIYFCIWAKAKLSKNVSTPAIAKVLTIPNSQYQLLRYRDITNLHPKNKSILKYCSLLIRYKDT